MKDLYNDFIHNFLKENHPEILKTIDTMYQPDLSHISFVIETYCAFVGINPEQIKGEYINYKDIQHRYKAIAMVLRIFQPEKLANPKKKVKSAIYKEMGPFLKLNNNALQKSIICGCNQYDLYSDFRKEIKLAANYYLIQIKLDAKKDHVAL